MGQTYGAAALPFARREIGVKEHPPGSNDGPRVAVFRMGHGPEAWCADFGTWCLVQAGFPMPTWNRSFCPSWLEAARAGVAGMRLLRPEEGLEPGLVVLYDWQGDGVVDHFGLLSRVTGPQNFAAIEGNTSPTSDSNGGAVMERSRSRADVGAFIKLPLVPVKASALPHGGTLRLAIGDRAWAGWGECMGPLRNIARHGLSDSTRCAIAWNGHAWRGAHDVAGVARHLVREFGL